MTLARLKLLAHSHPIAAVAATVARAWPRPVVAATVTIATHAVVAKLAHLRGIQLATREDLRQQLKAILLAVV